jgi:hypothetical protein
LRIGGLHGFGGMAAPRLLAAAVYECTPTAAAAERVLQFVYATRRTSCSPCFEQVCAHHHEQFPFAGFSCAATTLVGCCCTAACRCNASEAIILSCNHLNSPPCCISIASSLIATAKHAIKGVGELAVYQQRLPVPAAAAGQACSLLPDCIDAAAGSAAAPQLQGILHVSAILQCLCCALQAAATAAAGQDSSSEVLQRLARQPGAR